MVSGKGAVDIEHHKVHREAATKDPTSATRAAGGVDCNHSAMARFPAAHVGRRGHVLLLLPQSHLEEFMPCLILLNHLTDFNPFAFGVS